jgi:hypothetical protein
LKVKKMLDERTVLLSLLKDSVEKIQKHEESLETIVEKLTTASPGSGEMVKSEELYDSITVRSQHRITLSMLPVGAVCHIHVYKAKRPRPCRCGGDEACPLCGGKGEYQPVTRVLLERLT